MTSGARISLALAVAVLGTAAMGALLQQLVFSGWAHSFDSAIYVRSLWGVAHGALFNPMVGLNALSVHSNFVLFVLAPLARVFHPGAVLVATQAVAWGITLALVAAESHRVASRSVGATAALGVGGALALAAALTPMVTNPFLFDVRPDLLAVPFVTAGLLRARRVGRYDVVALGLLVAPVVLIREEFMMVAVGALGATPWSRSVLQQWRGRALGIALAVGWWATYWFLIRRWIGDGSAELAGEVALDFVAASPSALLGYKLEQIAVFAAGFGGLALLGWRWLPAAFPGLLLLLITLRMPELGLNFHYVMFIAPGLCVAAVDGLERLLAMNASRVRVVTAAVGVLVVTVFATSSALPGGGRFRSENFAFAAGPLADDALDRAALTALQEAAAGVPSEAGLALPWAVAAPVSDRAWVRSIEAVDEDLAGGAVLDDAMTHALVPARQWGRLGRFLAESGFGLQAVVGEQAALVVRGAPTRWDLLGAVPGECPQPAMRWPAAGFAVCRLAWRDDGRVEAEVVRSTPGPSPRLVLVPPGGAADGPHVELVVRGAPASLASLSPGLKVRLVSTAPIEGTALELAWSTGMALVPGELAAEGGYTAGDRLLVRRAGN